MIEQMTLAEIVKRRAADYGIDRPEELAAAMGMSYQHARCFAAGQVGECGD